MKRITENAKVTLTLKQLRQLVKEARNSDFKIDNGVLVKYKGKGGDVVIPDGVTEIGLASFVDCTRLTSVTIPDSVTRIEAHAFERCPGLTSVTIPDSVTFVGWAAFSDCLGLTSVTIEGNNIILGDEVFEGCTALKDINASQKIRDAILKTIHPSDGEDKQEEGDSDDTDVIADTDFGEVVDELEYHLLDMEGCADLKDDSGIETFREEVVYPAVSAFFNAGKTVEDKDEIMDFVEGEPDPYEFYVDKDPYED